MNPLSSNRIVQSALGPHVSPHDDAGSQDRRMATATNPAEITVHRPAGNGPYLLSVDVIPRDAGVSDIYGVRVSRRTASGLQPYTTFSFFPSPPRLNAAQRFGFTADKITEWPAKLVFELVPFNGDLERAKLEIVSVTSLSIGDIG